MSQATGESDRRLSRHHRLLWLLLGTGFALFLCSKFPQPTAISLGLFVGLLAAYDVAGQWAAHLVGRWTKRSTSASPAAALFASSAKVGTLFSVLSISLCLAVLIIQNSTGAPGPLPQVTGAIVFRAAVLPFLTCLGAACIVSDGAWTDPNRLQREDYPSPVDKRAPSSASYSIRPRGVVLGADHLAPNAGSQNPHQPASPERRGEQI